MTTEELLLLNNLMYIQPEMQKSDGTIGGWLKRLDEQGYLKNFKDDFTSHEDWMSMIDAVKNSDMADMQIRAADHESLNGGDEHSGEYNVILTNDQGEATVLFSGTRGEEWADDFYGGGATNASDGVSTAQQEKALDWYRDKYNELGLEDYNITVSGHSKGGNKAKYITILDDTVDNCVSFDGQGFSDDFLDEYGGKIAENQSKIQNHNCDNDYVNILLNDVGETTYYKGNSDNVGNFIENHCADAILHKDENGNYVLIANPDGQAKELKVLDKFFNNCLRSLSGEERRQMANTLGDLIQAAVSSEDKFSAVMRELASDPKNAASMSYLLAYMIKYQQENPEMMESLSQAFANFGMSDVAGWVDAAKFLMENDAVRRLIEVGATGLLEISGAGLPAILALLKANGLNISIDDLKMLLGILGMAEVFKDVIEISPDDGEDRKIGSGAGGRPANFDVHTQVLTDASGTLLMIKGEIDRIEQEVGDVKDKLFLYNFFSFGRIRRLEDRLQTNSRECKKIGESLAGVAKVYERYETRVIDHAASNAGVVVSQGQIQGGKEREHLSEVNSQNTGKPNGNLSSEINENSQSESNSGGMNENRASYTEDNGKTKNFVDTGETDGGDYSDYRICSNYDPSVIIDQHDHSAFNTVHGNDGCACCSEAMAYNMMHPDAPISPEDCRTGNSHECQNNYSSVIPGSGDMDMQGQRNTMAEYIDRGQAVRMWYDHDETAHNVLAVGVREGADRTNVQPEDILCIDPSDGKVKTLADCYAYSRCKSNTYNLRIAE